MKKEIFSITTCQHFISVMASHKIQKTTLVSVSTKEINKYLIECPNILISNIFQKIKPKKIKKWLWWCTFIILDPSNRYLMRFPTISAGNTTSSNIASCTAVSVRLRGLWTAEPFFGGLNILLVAIRITS